MVVLVYKMKMIPMIILILTMFVLVLNSTLADTYNPTATFEPTENNITYNVPLSGINDTTRVLVNDTCVTIVGGLYATELCTIYTTPTIKTLCSSDLDCTGTENVCDTDKTCTVPVVGGTAVSSGDSSGSPTMQDGDCPVGFISWNLQCIQDTILKQLQIIGLDLGNITLCDNRKTYFEVKAINNLNQFQSPSRVEVTIGDLTYQTKNLLGSFLFNQQILFNEKESVKMDVRAYDTIQDIEYSVSYNATVQHESCPMIKTNYLNEIKYYLGMGYTWIMNLCNMITEYITGMVNTNGQ